jgi:hypothetical protein
MKIIVHVGAGKTGTTSIQNTLMVNQKKLNSMGVYYFGVILEYAALIKYEWQSFPAGKLLNTADERLHREVVDIFETSIPFFENQGIHTLIWSNESFLNHSKKIIPILQELGNKYEIEIVVYVRQYEAWIQSAYMQWGIKHKTYTGKIKTFREWYSSDKVLFYKKIEPYLQVFPNKVIIKNMGAQKNLVESFLNVCAITHENMQIVKSNESPSVEELLLRSLFNDKFNDKNILPNLFDKQVLNNSHLLSYTPSEYISQLMPNVNDLKKVTSDVEQDRNLLNTLLMNAQEEEFVSDTLNPKNLSVDSDKLIIMIAQIIMRQAIEIEQLKQELQKINKTI